MKIRTSILASSSMIALALALGPAYAAPGAAQRARIGASVDENAPTRDVVIVVVGLRNDAGELLGGLYDGPSTWLGADQARQDCHAAIHAGRARCVFHALSSDAVAFAALHDEDGDGELDRDPIGIPSEGYAFSNDVREPFGPPSFDAAAFSPRRATPFVVHVRYGI